MSYIHPPDLSKALKDLATRGFFQSAGATRATVYIPQTGTTRIKCYSPDPSRCSGGTDDRELRAFARQLCAFAG